MSNKPLSMAALAELDAIAKTTNAIGGPTMLSGSLWHSDPIYSHMVKRRLISWRRRSAGSAMCEVAVLPDGHALLAAALQTGLLARARAEADAKESAEADCG